MHLSLLGLSIIIDSVIGPVSVPLSAPVSGVIVVIIPASSGVVATTSSATSSATSTVATATSSISAGGPFLVNLILVLAQATLSLGRAKVESVAKRFTGRSLGPGHGGTVLGEETPASPEDLSEHLELTVTVLHLSEDPGQVPQAPGIHKELFFDLFQMHLAKR